ncbi:hypothetical protein [Pontibacillus halophilus]|nr:hypothetical protein [Pontibacillus halophilus]
MIPILLGFFLLITGYLLGGLKKLSIIPGYKEEYFHADKEMFGVLSGAALFFVALLTFTLPYAYQTFGMSAYVLYGVIVVLCIGGIIGYVRTIQKMNM